MNRCLQGLTQNQNESLNGVLWSICPKNIFCRWKTVESAAREAINQFNVSALASAELLSSLSINPGSNMMHEIGKENTRRINAAAKKVTGKARVNRQRLRSKKKNKIEQFKLYSRGI